MRTKRLNTYRITGFRTLKKLFNETVKLAQYVLMSSKSNKDKYQEKLKELHNFEKKDITKNKMESSKELIAPFFKVKRLYNSRDLAKRLIKLEIRKKFKFKVLIYQHLELFYKIIIKQKNEKYLQIFMRLI